MTKAHTPAPWKINKAWRIEGNDGKAICQMNNIATLKGEIKEPKEFQLKIAETTKANARLIASAPELLAALETLLKSYDEETTGVFLHGEHAARLAIAKAKGGAE